MNRRDSLKTMSIALGYVVATPTLFQLLSACENEKGNTWHPQFLSETQVLVVEQLVDIILPASETLGGLDVEIPKFIDLILSHVLPQIEQENFKKGANAFHGKFESVFNKIVSKGIPDEFTTLLNTYFKISTDKQARVFELMQKDASSVSDPNSFYIYKYLICIRHYALLGYYSSKQVGTEILNYDPVPGVFEACVPVEDVGNVSSI